MPCWLERSNLLGTDVALTFDLRGDFLGEQLLQFAGLMHLEKNVAAADEFPIDVDLGNRGPSRELFDSLADFGVFQDVDVLEFGTGGLKNFRCAVGKTALGKVLGAFHEEHHPVLFDDFLDFTIDFTHGTPSAPLT